MRTLLLTLATLAAVGASIAPVAPAAAQQPNAAAAPSLSEQTIRDVVRAFNSGDPAVMRSMIERHFAIDGPQGVPVGERVNRLMSIRGDLGEVTIHRIAADPDGRPMVTVQSGRTEGWMAWTFMLDGATPPRITGVRLSRAEAPDAPMRRLTDAEIVEQLRGYVERLAKRDVFSGTVMLAKHGKPLWQAAYGEANKDFGVKSTLDTKFNLGSMNKMFTAVAVMQLAEAGKLSLDDTLGKFLPAGAMRPEVLSTLRIEHLLTHTSGLGSYFNETWDRQSRALYRSVDDWMELVKDDTLRFAPGSRWAYSNTGMLVLGKVIEVASGMDYFDYIRERIAKPAGMTNTDAYELDRVNRNLAVGYFAERTPDGMEWRNNIFMHVIRGGPAGGGYSTVEDLTRFAEALKSGKLVSRESVKLLTTAKPELNSPDYGYGFGIEANGRIAGHGGGFPGINAQLDIYLEDGYTLAVMSNYGRGAQPIVDRSRSLILAGRSEMTAR